MSRRIAARAAPFAAGAPASRITAAGLLTGWITTRCTDAAWRLIAAASITVVATTPSAIARSIAIHILTTTGTRATTSARRTVNVAIGRAGAPVIRRRRPLPPIDRVRRRLPLDRGDLLELVSRLAGVRVVAAVVTVGVMVIPVGS